MPVDIEFSLHSLAKIEMLKSHGVSISKKIVKDVIRFPDKTEVVIKEGLSLKKASMKRMFLG
jgi:hypothetical protein